MESGYKRLAGRLDHKNDIPSGNPVLARPRRHNHPPVSSISRKIITVMFIAIIGVVLLLSPIASCRQHYIPSDNRIRSHKEHCTHPRFPPLAFRPDGTFQISIFEDLHFGENAWESWGPRQDINSVKVMNRILDVEPDIGVVVLNGDLITGENTFLENSTHYLDQIVAPMLDRNLTWASTYGNHDSNYNISREDLFAREKLWPNSRTRSMVSNPNAGTTNYYLPVYHDSSCTKHTCTPALLLWFFDSRGGHLFRQEDPISGEWIDQPDWVDPSVAAWFEQTNSRLVKKANGKVIPSMAFVHIPINASVTIQSNGIDPHRQPGINADKPLAQQGQSWCPDGTVDGSCPYAGQDVPFMQAIARTPGLMALFSGHDHGNTWCKRWDGSIDGSAAGGKGVNLCFGQHTGYGGYGDWIRGARQVVVSLAGLENDEDYVVDTYIRLENGGVVGAVSLNSTYGEDGYPVTPDDRTKCDGC